MADKQTYLDVHNGKREVRLPLPQATESFVLGKGKDATFRLREHGLLDAHAKLSRDKVTGAWRLDALPGADFQLEGSPSSRQTAVVKVGQVATLSPNCFIRLTHEQPKLFERIMTTNKVGGKSPVIYAMTVLAIVSVPMFLLLALWPQQSTQKELDAHLTCGVFGNTAPLNETYTSRSWQYERLNGPSYYSCIQDTEAACKYTALSRSTMRSNVEMIANACASRFAISGSEDEVRAGLRATLEGRISESQARLSELTPEDDEKRRIEASSIEQDQQRLSLLDQVCFSCRELEELSDEELRALPDDDARSELFAEYRRKLLACEHGQEMADLFRRAGAARRGGQLFVDPARRVEPRGKVATVVAPKPGGWRSGCAAPPRAAEPSAMAGGTAEHALGRVPDRPRDAPNATLAVGGNDGPTGTNRTTPTTSPVSRRSALMCAG